MGTQRVPPFWVQRALEGNLNSEKGESVPALGLRVLKGISLGFRV